MTPVRDPVAEALSELTDLAAAYEKGTTAGRSALILRRALVTACQDVSALALAELGGFGEPNLIPHLRQTSLDLGRTVVPHFCPCGKKLASECTPDDRWEPGCDLGNNAAHAKAVADPYAEAKAAWRDGELEIAVVGHWTHWGYDFEPTWDSVPSHYRRRPARTAEAGADGVPPQVTPAFSQSPADPVRDALRVLADHFTPKSPVLEPYCTYRPGDVQFTVCHRGYGRIAIGLNPVAAKRVMGQLAGAILAAEGS